MGIKVSQLTHFHNVASVILGAPAPDIEVQNITFEKTGENTVAEMVTYSYKGAEVSVSIMTRNLSVK